MVAPCALCKGKNPKRTHVFPQNSRGEVQLKWVKALGIPQEKEESILTEMRQMEQKGSRPRWCSFHFEYDSAGIHFPKYFDPEEGKAAQGFEEEEQKDEGEGEGPSTKDDSTTSRDRSSTPTEPRRSTRRKITASTESTSETPIISSSLQKILAEAGISVPEAAKESTPKASTSREEKRTGEKGATAVEKTLQDILMGAGLPIPETLQARTGVHVEEGGEKRAPPNSRRMHFVAAAASDSAKKITVADAKRMGTFVSARVGGSAVPFPKQLVNPISKYSSDVPKIVIPKQIAGKLPSQCYNHATMERYDDSDSLRNLKMKCKTEECKSEITVIINRARALEDQFEELSNNVFQLVQMYNNKTPLSYRPAQSLATIQGRAASVAGPVYGRVRESPLESLSVQERRERRETRRVGDKSKEPERLLTADDLANTVRRKVAKQDMSSAEEDDDVIEVDSGPDDDWNPSTSKRRRLVSSNHEVDTSTSEASPPMLDIIE